MADQKIGIQDLIYQVKKELLEVKADDPAPLFFVEGVELELAVVVEGKGTGGVKLYVVDVGTEVRKENTQTVKVKLESLFTREEMRTMIETDPALKEQLRQNARKGLVKEMGG